MKKLVAVFTVMLIVIGGFGIAAAMPDDIVEFETPEERAIALDLELTGVKQSIDKAYKAGQISIGAKLTLIDSAERDTAQDLKDYTKMYYQVYDNENVLTGNDDVNWEKKGSELWVGRTGISRGYDETIVVVPYMQRQVDNKVAELTGNETIENIQVEIVVTGTWYTYPGGPIIKLYHFEVTWDIYGEMY